MGMSSMSNMSTVIFAAALSLNAAAALAQIEHEADHPESAPPAEASTQQASTTPMMELMQKHMEEMQSHWQEMSQAQDPAERRKLIQAHREKMREMSAMFQAQGMMPMVKRMEEMDSDLDKILETDDSQERQRLIREHHKKMSKTIDMMRNGPSPMAMMGGQGGMMGGQGGCPMMGDQKPDVEQMHQSVERRLELIQRLVEQLLEYHIK